MTHEELYNYAGALIDGTMVEEGAPLFVKVQYAEQMPIAMAMAEVAIDRGQPIEIIRPSHDLSDSELEALPDLSDDIVAMDGILISLESYGEIPDPENPIEAQIQAERREMAQQAFRSYNQAKGANDVRWSLCPVPTRQWAEKVFPDLSGDQAQRKLAEILTQATHADEGPGAARRHIENLQTKADVLTENIKEYEFEAPGTKLKMKVADGAKTMPVMWDTVRGSTACVNNPTQEVFTTPDVNSVEGYMTTTRPITVPNIQTAPGVFETLVVNPGAKFEFEQGKIVRVTGVNAQDTAVLQAVFNEQRGTNVVGELGLVDSDNPIAKAGVNFFSTLFDEQGGVHLGLGKAFTGITGGSNTAQTAGAHMDVTIGSKEMTVTGIDASGNRAKVIENGSWNV
jgi:aminopeptidase